MILIMINRIPIAVILSGFLFIAPSLAAANPKVLSGIDVLERDGFKELRGKRVGLIANRTSRDRLGRLSADILAKAPGVRLVEILALEHGFYLDTQAPSIKSGAAFFGGREIAVKSLYRGGIAGMRPTPEDLKGVDALVFDVQDVGARFYTYLASMAMAMEAADKAGVEFIVLDRPNPVTGTIVEGPILDDSSLRLKTPTAYFAVPIRHGLTAGEMARFYNAELKDPRLLVVPMSGWRRKMWYDQTGLVWTPPSPNIPDLTAALLYSGVGIFEASNLSVGRGTTRPFEWIGAPWLRARALLREIKSRRLPGVRFALEDRTPKASLYRGVLCRGLRLTVTNRDDLRPVDVFLALNQAITRANPRRFAWRWPELKRMIGTAKFQKMLEQGAGVEKIEAFFRAQAAAFAKTRGPYLLYR
ncbi:MAG: exo-beta-N-acetylmuramidase NamZ family protein [Elusimicrobiota bacterium]